MFKLQNLFGLSITVGHQLLYSTPMLDFFYLGTASNADLKFVLYKLKEILFSLLILRCFLVSILKRRRFIFLLIFSNISQYLVVAELFDSLVTFNQKLGSNPLAYYFMLSPEAGFLSSMSQRAISYQEDVDLAKNICFNNTLVFSFGDAVLPITAREVSMKRGIVVAIVDSNQLNV